MKQSEVRQSHFADKDYIGKPNQKSDQKQQKEQSGIVKKIRNILENAQCDQRKQVFLICCTQNCNISAPICGVKKCQCKKKHKKCQNYLNLDNLGDILQDKYKKQAELTIKVEQIFETLIDQLSELREKVIISLKRIYLTDNDLAVVQKINNAEIASLRGDQLSKCSFILSPQVLKQSQTKKSQRFIQIMSDLQQETYRQMHQCQLSLVKDKFFDKVKSGLSVMNVQKLLFGSEILSTNQQVLTLKSFMPHHKFSQLKLLYRGSQNIFSIKQFWQTCTGIPHTMVLILTQHHKIIGGYTPVPWKVYPQATQQADPSGQSFIFSLTQGDKLKLSDKNFATYFFDEQTGPQFGKIFAGDLSINDHLLQSNEHFCLAGMVYKNDKYKFSQEQSYQKFSGNSTWFFKIIDWEVFEVVF